MTEPTCSLASCFVLAVGNCLFGVITLDTEGLTFGSVGGVLLGTVFGVLFDATTWLGAVVASTAYTLGTTPVSYTHLTLPTTERV